MREELGTKSPNKSRSSSSTYDVEMNVMSKNPYTVFGSLAIVLIAGLSTSIWLQLELPLWIALVAAVNVISIFFVGLDKSLSKGKSLRVPESILFLLGLLGGSLSVFVAMQIFRHKTQKAAFHFVLLLIFFTQIGIYKVAILDQRISVVQGE